MHHGIGDDADVPVFSLPTRRIGVVISNNATAAAGHCFGVSRAEGVWSPSTERFKYKSFVTSCSRLAIECNNRHSYWLTKKRLIKTPYDRCCAAMMDTAISLGEIGGGVASAIWY